MVNTAFELGRTSAAVKSCVNTYRRLFLDKFAQSLVNDKIPDPDRKAEFLVGMLWGALSQIRLMGHASAARAIVEQSLQTLDSW